MTKPLQAGVVAKALVYEAAYETIRQGAPGLSDATCAVLARSINMKVSLLDVALRAAPTLDALCETVDWSPVLPDGGWRPMDEPMPRDGSWIVVVDKWKNARSVRWDDTKSKVFPDAPPIGWVDKSGFRPSVVIESHQVWMPLPDAPAEGAQ